MASSDSLAVDVWQFVRIMVALERSARKGRRPSSTYTAWREIWRELDQRLSDLGKTNAAEYSELMMEQQVLLPLPRPAIAREALQAIETVTRDMTTELERGGGDASHQADLRFERKELNALARRLAGRSGERARRNSSPPEKNTRHTNNRQRNKH